LEKEIKINMPKKVMIQIAALIAYERCDSPTTCVGVPHIRNAKKETNHLSF
jgi:hypothetical protein